MAERARSHECESTAVEVIESLYLYVQRIIREDISIIGLFITRETSECTGHSFIISCTCDTGTTELYEAYWQAMELLGSVIPRAPRINDYIHLFV